MISSPHYREFIAKKEKEAEEKKSKKKHKDPDEGRKESEGKGKTLVKKKKVKDWKCKNCKASWNGEVKSGVASKWVKCETCNKRLHAKCIPKKHCVDFVYVNLCKSDNSDSDEDVAFICPDCAHLESDYDGKFPFTTSSEEDD